MYPARPSIWNSPKGFPQQWKAEKERSALWLYPPVPQKQRGDHRHPLRAMAHPLCDQTSGFLAHYHKSDSGRIPLLSFTVSAPSLICCFRYLIFIYSSTDIFPAFYARPTAPSVCQENRLLCGQVHAPCHPFPLFHFWPEGSQPRSHHWHTGQAVSFFVQKNHCHQQ